MRGYNVPATFVALIIFLIISIAMLPIRRFFKKRLESIDKKRLEPMDTSSARAYDYVDAKNANRVASGVTIFAAAVTLLLLVLSVCTIVPTK